MDDQSSEMFADLPDDYEAPAILDLGSVFEVTRGSSLGGSDLNGQGLF